MAAGNDKWLRKFNPKIDCFADTIEIGENIKQWPLKAVCFNRALHVKSLTRVES